MQINKGDKFLCIKGVPDSYQEGKVYQSEQDGCITDDHLVKNHYWDRPTPDSKFSLEKNFQKIEGTNYGGCFLTEPVNPLRVQAAPLPSPKEFAERFGDVFSCPVVPFDNKQPRVFETGAKRDTNAGKPFIHCLMGYTRQRFGYHMAKNAHKYGAFNFLKGIPTDAYLESLDRHLAAYISGDRSEDHLSAILFGVQGCMLNEQKDGIPSNHYFN
jgi:hypothetical protein